MSNFSDFISGGGSASFPTIFLHNSQTWVPPQDGNIMIHVIGAGGSGSGTVSGPYQSGGAGGYCKKNSLAVTTSGSFTVTIGAGGASRIASSGAGNAGGNTTVAGTGLGSTLTANGGAGGAVAGGAASGGSATGGDVNNTGGNGGYRKGGGAVGLSGGGITGGSVSGWENTFGANCNILGDFYSSSLGQISGGRGGSSIYLANTQDASVGQNEAGPLAGGAGMVNVSMYSCIAGHASIGGGGGFGDASVSSSVYSGRGGEGCVVIQYIP